MAERSQVFTAALTAVESKYVGEVQSDRLVYGAISGMLQTLDPHSSFMDPKSYAQMRERQEGRYYGLGISIQRRSTATSPSCNVFEGSPAYQRGMRRGDVIAKIEDDEHQGLDERPGRAASCAGRKGTSVNDRACAAAATTS